MSSALYLVPGYHQRHMTGAAPQTLSATWASWPPAAKEALVLSAIITVLGVTAGAMYFAKHRILGGLGGYLGAAIVNRVIYPPTFWAQQAPPALPAAGA